MLIRATLSSCINSFIALASASRSLTGTMYPLTFSSTVSRQPAVSVVMTGRSIDIASIMTRGIPSR